MDSTRTTYLGQFSQERAETITQRLESPAQEPTDNRPEGQRSPTSPRHDAYDVVVVGGGLGGLSAAALLAKAGERVLVVERGDGPGGCAHAFRRGPYLFDPAGPGSCRGGSRARVRRRRRGLL